jgi:hypothetical protein
MARVNSCHHIMEGRFPFRVLRLVFIFYMQTMKDKLTEDNIRLAKEFFAATGRGDTQALERAGRWPEHMLGTRALQMWFKKHLKSWKWHTHRPPNSWPRETGFLLSELQPAKSKPQTKRLRMIGSSTSQFETAD